MTSSVAVPVAVHGWTWTATLMTVLNIMIGGAIAAWVKSRPKMREIEQQGEERLRTDLIQRVEKLERHLEDERLAREIERLRHEAERAADRHKLNNVTQCLDMLLTLIELDPGKAAVAAARVRAMREAQQQSEAVEKAALHSNAIAAKVASTQEQPAA